jgi:hypothetical protein
MKSKGKLLRNSMHNSSSLKEDVLLFLLIQEKKGIKSVKFKDICEKLKKPDKTISECLKDLLKESPSLINKEKFGKYRLYSLTKEGEKKAKDIREERRIKIKEAIINHFMKDEKLDKLIFIIKRDYLKIPIISKLKYFIKKCDINSLLKNYIIHTYIEPIERIEFIYEEECIENIKDFWIKNEEEDYLEKEKSIMNEIIGKIKLEYIKKLFEENKSRIFKDIYEYSKNSNLFIKERIKKISKGEKIFLGLFIGMISSFLALFLLCPFLLLYRYLFPLEIEIPFLIRLTPYGYLYNLFIASVASGTLIGIAHSYLYEKSLFYYISRILLLFFLPYVILYSIFIYFLPYIKIPFLSSIPQYYN